MSEPGVTESGMSESAVEAINEAPMRVVLADDSVLLREGVRSLLEDEGISVVASVDDGHQLLAAVADTRPDLAIVDVRMPPTHTTEGLEAALAIKRRFPDIGVLVLSQYVLREYATELLSTETVGVGYLLKNRVTDIDRFLDSVNRIAEGGTVIDPEVVRQLLSSSEKQNSLSALTPRENEVLETMAEGLSNRGIAERLYVSISSVEKAISSIFDKLGLHAGQTTSRRVAAVLHYLDQS
ncbi:MAG: response regulator [Brevibacterium aurantiacum]|uniref:DNA-binding response regulator n=1 Tax=Brevibacterium aurantiacum TaxID=273384 RepID=A0A1D7W2R1_BREAU|nr:MULTISPECIES: response regulator transcription factor [Brevibacterium]AOP53317.1 two-component system response regulator [Brevibacterium aurantiacum]AZT97025.1 DNA-binding response regulator [Brevibacterium aurantiacum]PCC44298.1 DNA-binding response regulator [Brevibacterium aurantiacum]PCC45387.1 DNA-binding response regulator [Brevibacterium aurantiacum]PCC49335.1 DNA-binding response regulator [Brevibacterium aurantiacum]